MIRYLEWLFPPRIRVGHMHRLPGGAILYEPGSVTYQKIGLWLIRLEITKLHPAVERLTRRRKRQRARKIAKNHQAHNNH